MNPIRPSVLPPTPQGAQSQGSARLSAQKAFFAAALGQAQAPGSVSTPAEPAPATAQAAPSAGRPADAPQKILRPGSLIDIRV